MYQKYLLVLLTAILTLIIPPAFGQGDENMEMGEYISVTVTRADGETEISGAQTLGEQLDNQINEELKKEENKIPGKAILLIYSNTEWSGSILDSSFDSASRDGSGNAKISLRCEGSNGIYSLTMQKQSEGGYLALAVIQDGKLLDTTFTSAQYGVASLAGNCQPAAFGGGGGCLIATAAFGSELTPQVQFLRNFRDNHILSTVSGSSFMTVFNTWYYSFSPYVADYEREQPWLQQTVKAMIYPLLAILQASEKAYFAIPGEYGSLAAGLIASSLIGAVYVSPALLSVKRIRKAKVDYRIPLVVIAAASVGVIGSLMADNASVLMVTTSMLVVSTLVVAAIFSANLMSRAATKISKALAR